MIKHNEKDILDMELTHIPSGMKMKPIRAYKKDVGVTVIHSRWFVDIQFEDGVIVQDKSLASFLQCKVIHPVYFKGWEYREKSTLGKEVIASNGMKATITKYLGRNKVEITFEDGTISPTTSLDCFNKGQISYSLVNKRVGEKSLSRNGETIEIVTYNNCNDIDVRFDDGRIQNTSYWAFKHQEVTRQHAEDRLGEVSTTSSGEKITIIAYRNSHDIDIQLEDGTVLEHKLYRDFKEHLISGKQKIKVDIGDVFYQSKINMNATIIDRIQGNLIVELEDGTIRDKRVSIKNLREGKLDHPKFIECNVDHTVNGIKYFNCRCRHCKENHIISIHCMKDFECTNEVIVDKTTKTRNAGGFLDRKGEVIELPDGTQATIVEYRRSTDIDIEYNGEIYKNKNYAEVKKGYIISRLEQHKSRVGETLRNNQGEKMTIVAYRSASDIDIQFEDGTMVTNKRYSNFVRGTIAKNKNNRVGEINTNGEGYKMEIIGYRNTSDIDIQFEDGTILRNRQYSNFLTGAISKTGRRNAETFRQNELYKRIQTKFGLDVWFIDYKSQKDATIQFEDGTIVNVTNAKNVERGHASHPKYMYAKMHHKNQDKIYYVCQCKVCHKKHLLELKEMKDYECTDNTEKLSRFDKSYNEKIGKRYRCLDGMQLEIVGYRGYNDIDVQFSDGTVVNHVEYRRFTDGKIKHPKYSKIIRAGRYKDMDYFLCTCKVCKGKHCLKLSEMKDFECQSTNM